MVARWLVFFSFLSGPSCCIRILSPPDQLLKCTRETDTVLLFFLNSLILSLLFLQNPQCETTTKCPNGDECADDEFCYTDFVCDPLLIPSYDSTSSTVSSDWLPDGAESISTPDINSPTNIGGDTDPDGSASSQPGDGCELCGAGIDGSPYDIRKNVVVDFYGDEISCSDLAIKVLLQFGTASDQCVENQRTHFADCWYVI
jgi:hypothetical protein